jgi:flagellin
MPSILLGSLLSFSLPVFADNITPATTLHNTADLKIEDELQEIINLLIRMRTRAVYAINYDLSRLDRLGLQLEVAQLRIEIDRLASTTQFGSENGALLGVYRYATAGTVGAAVLSNTASNNFAAQNLTITNCSNSVTLPLIAGEMASDIVTRVRNSSINTTGGVGVSATTTATLSNLSRDGYVQLTLNAAQYNHGAGVAIGAYVTPSDLSQLVTAINNVTSETNITAAMGRDSSVIVLTDFAGNDIQITDFINAYAPLETIEITGNSGAPVTLPSPDARAGAVVGGTVTFSSINSFSISTNAAGSLLAAASEVPTFAALSSIDVSTVAGAESALGIIDSAIDQVINALENAAL